MAGKADHRQGSGADVPLLAPHLVDGDVHTVIDAPAQHVEGVIMSVEQHFVGLQ